MGISRYSLRLLQNRLVFKTPQNLPALLQRASSPLPSLPPLSTDHFGQKKGALSPHLQIHKVPPKEYSGILHCFRCADCLCIRRLCCPHRHHHCHVSLPPPPSRPASKGTRLTQHTHNSSQETFLKRFFFSGHPDCLRARWHGRRHRHHRCQVRLPLCPLRSRDRPGTAAHGLGRRRRRSRSAVPVGPHFGRGVGTGLQGVCR